MKIGTEAYLKKREADINRARYDMIVNFATFMHNDYGFDRDALTKLIEGLVAFLMGLNNFKGDPIIDMQDILLKETNFDIMQVYNDSVNKQNKGA